MYNGSTNHGAFVNTSIDLQTDCFVRGRGRGAGCILYPFPPVFYERFEPGSIKILNTININLVD